MYYNASLFNIESNYSVSLSVNVTQNAESQGGTSTSDCLGPWLSLVSNLIIK